MKKAKLLGMLLCGASLVLGSAVPAMADGTRVVTLGADLDEAQKQTMLKYFKAPEQVYIITVTNQDERQHLGSYVPLEQIGNRTVSCAYVNPTSSGGIKVRTANLNWVTCNMIASTLSTSGVKNCEVVAACPFEVSGTGALTGIQMAYETASGVKLSETKKNIATQEMVVTGKLADRIGKKPATKVINQAKMEVIGNNVTNSGDIYNIVVNVVQENNVDVGTAEIETITALMEEIAGEDYDYEDMQETLERVDENVSWDTDEDENGTLVSDEPEGELLEEMDNGILDEVDSDILENAVEDSTEDTSLEVDSGMEGLDEGDGEMSPDDEWDFAINADGEIVDADVTDDTQVWEEVSPEEGNVSVDGGDMMEEMYPVDDTLIVDGGEPVDNGQMPEETYPADDTLIVDGGDMMEETYPADGTVTADPMAPVLDTSLLSEQSRSMFEKAKAFCEGEYQGDSAQLMNAVTGDETYSYGMVILDAATGTQLSQSVEEIYYTILRDGAGSYIPTGMEVYINPELNLLDQKLKTVFEMDGLNTGTGILMNVNEIDRQTLYNDTMHFFAFLYGESNDMMGDADGDLSNDMNMDIPAEDAYGVDGYASYDEYASYDAYGYDVY